VRAELDVVLVKRVDETLAAALEAAAAGVITPLPLPRETPARELRAA
jgi:hypothetical protein